MRRILPPRCQLLVDGSSQQVSTRCSAAGQIIAARTVNGGQEGLNWLLDDPLGSAALSLNADGPAYSPSSARRAVKTASL